MHAGLGLIAIIGLIAFAFGEQAARRTVQVLLVLAAIVLLYVAYRVVSGTI
jgi:hypothetical protein